MLVPLNYLPAWQTQTLPRGQGWTCLGKKHFLHSWQGICLVSIACQSSVSDASLFPYFTNTVFRRAPGALHEVYYFLEGVHVRIQGCDGLQQGHFFISNHNSGYEYSSTSFAFLARACSNLMLYAGLWEVCCLVSDRVVRKDECWKRGPESFFQGRSVTTTFLTGPMARLRDRWDQYYFSFATEHVSARHLCDSSKD